MTDKSSAPDAEVELANLVSILHQTQQRIQVLTDGAVDAVLDSSSGAVYLLPHSQAHLRQSESEQRHFAAERASILDALPANIALLDSKGLIVAVNGAWRRFAAANMPPEDSCGVGGSYLAVVENAFVPSSYEAQAATAGVRAVLAGDAAEFAAEFAHFSSGQRRWFRLQVTPLFGGGAQGAVAMHVDITARKLAGEALRVSEERFRGTFRHAVTGMTVVDRNGLILEANAAFCMMTGYTEGELRTMDFQSLTHPDDRSFNMNLVGDLLSGKRGGFNIEKRYLTKSGGTLWCRVSVSANRDSAGRPVEVIAIAEDISERKAAEQARDETEKRSAEQAALLDVAQDAILVQDMAHRVLFWNRSAERMYGWTTAEALGQSVENLLFIDKAIFRRAAAATALDGHWTDRIEQQRKDGTHLTVQGKWTLVQDAKGQPHSILAVNTDITDNLALEEQLRQSQRLEAMGQLTGGIAHDFNNLLTVILGNSEILIEQMKADEELHVLAAMIMLAAERGAELTHRLLAFSRHQVLEPKVVNVNRLVASIEGMLRRTLPENISIELVLSGVLWDAVVDPAQLENAILNLSINGRDAMVAGGKLTLETVNAHLDNEYAEAHGDVGAGQYIAIAISDTGTGIPASVIGRVFDPFFTTKELGKGTGLGLSMVYGFMKQSGGHVNIESQVGHGTTVKLYLPRAVGQVEAIHEPSAIVKVAGGSETILIVEDDDLVRATVEAQFRALGYRVFSAANGPKALDVFRKDTQIDLLFTDVIMPDGMNGMQLADAAHRINPLVQVLFTTGYSDETIDHQGRLNPGVHVLRKPYRYADLARMARVALADVRRVRS